MAKVCTQKYLQWSEVCADVGFTPLRIHGISYGEADKLLISPKVLADTINDDGEMDGYTLYFPERTTKLLKFLYSLDENTLVNLEG